MSDKNEGYFKSLLHKALRFWNQLTKRKSSATISMSIKDIEPGDVLLFSGESLISEAIILVTGGGVSHAAIAYDDIDLVHEVPPHAARGVMAELFEGRTISVMRVFDSQHKEQIPKALTAANQFVKDKEPYPMSNLYLLGLVLLYRTVTPNTLTQKYITKVLRIVIAELEEFIRMKRQPGKLPMVCSQFVYQCYAHAGVQLKIRNGVVIQNLTNKLAFEDVMENKQLSLLDRIVTQPLSSPINQMSNAASNNIELGGNENETQEDQDAVITGLLNALKQEAELVRDAFEPGRDTEQMPELQVAQIPESELSVELVQTANQFASCMVNAIELSTEVGQSGYSEPLKLLQQNEAMFVTPTDLLLHCEALEKVGTIPA